MHRRLALLLATAFTLAVACNKQAAPTKAPGDAAVATESPAGIEDLERELGQLEAELAERRIALESVPTGDPAGAGPGDRCVRVCDLSEAICGLKDQICGLVADHEDEPRYTDACTRATDDCDRATEACDGCSS